MIVSTDAIILRSMKYGDTSKIVTVYSRKYGKMKVIAKGARGAKTKFGASLEPMTHSSIVVYRKEHRDLHLLSKSEIAEPLLRLSADGNRLAVGLAIVELVNMVMHDEEENHPMFSLLLDSLQALNLSSGNTENILFAFELRMLELFGYGLDVNRCSKCGRDIVVDPGTESGFLMLSTGSVICSECHSTFNAGGIRLSKEMIRSFIHLRNAELKSVTDMRLSAAMKEEMFALLHMYLKYHIEGVRTLKSLSVFINT